MKDNALPEEKLLKLIRGGQKQETILKTKPAFVAEDAKPAPAQSLWQLIQHNLFFARSYKLQKILLAAFVLSCALFVFSLLYPVFYSVDISAPLKTPDDPSAAENVLPTSAKPLDYYTKTVNNRQIFSSAQPADMQPQAGIAGLELSKDINLVGIIMGAQPEAVIEDKKANKVFYVSQGSLIGEYQVEEIQESKVIVSRNGQRYELHL